ncbi:MAG: SPFH domain-containing protein, partial [Flavobacteriales bacterium]
LVFGVIAVVLLFMFGSNMSTNVQPGEKGVMFYTLGNGLDTQEVYGQGMNFYLPWNKMIVYNVKTQTLPFRVDGKDSAQVQCALAMNVIYRPIPEEIGLLENEIGADYVNKLIKPKLEDIALTVIKQFDYKSIISNKKDDVKLLIEKMMKAELSSRHIIIEEIKISDIIISDEIEASITRVVKAEQLMLEQKYVKERALEEKAIKLIQADAEAEYNLKVMPTLTHQILQFKGIEATKEIAKSPNSKVIVIGNSDGDLPIILGGK